MKIDESNYDVIRKAEDYTSTDYGIIWKDAENIDGVIPVENLLNIVEDLMCEIGCLNEKIEDLERPKEHDDYDAYQDYMLEQSM